MISIRKLTQHGFTMLELIAVIVVVGLIALTTVPRWTGNVQNVQYEARRVLNDIRYAQAMSISSGMRYYWNRTSGTSYQIINGSGSAIVLPSGGTTVTLSSGISFGSFSNLPSNLVAFDSRGQPYTTSSSPGTLLSSTAVIPLTDGSSTRSVSITPTTGHGDLS